MGGGMVQKSGGTINAEKGDCVIYYISVKKLAPPCPPVFMALPFFQVQKIRNVYKY